jgi:hypothetical protein
MCLALECLCLQSIVVCSLVPLTKFFFQRGEADISQIDPVFVKEPAQISPSDPTHIDRTDQENFEGYVAVP